MTPAGPMEGPMHMTGPKAGPLTGPLVIGLDEAGVRSIAAGIGGHLLVQPAVNGHSTDWRWADALETWRDDAIDGPTAAAIVVALMPGVVDPTPHDQIDIDSWVARCELILARWIAALGVAQRRCVDGGVIVAVVDRAAPLDCAGRSTETAVSDAVEALIRSLARSEGPRGVRVNLVTTPSRVTTGPVVDPRPPLAGFPGSIDGDVIPTCRMLLSPDATALTGSILHVDAGRSWR